MDAVPKCLLLALLLASALTAAQIAETSLGPIQGFEEVVSVDGEEKTISKFLEVPYAKPPVGDLRLEPPRQLDPWDDTLNAIQYPSQCIQLEAKLLSMVPGAHRAMLDEI